MKLFLKKQNKELVLKPTTFPDGDSYCYIEDIESFQDEDVVISARAYSKQNERLSELYLVLDLIKDYAQSITLVIPYMPYSRQFASFETICSILSSLGANELYTLDSHYLKGKPEATIRGLKIHNFVIKDELLSNIAGEYDLISPDEGASYLGNQSFIKTRDNNKQVSSMSLGTVKLSKEHCVIIDDMISTGTTMIKAINNVKQLGVDKVSCVVTHGLFLNNSHKEISELTHQIICSDSVSKGIINSEKYLLTKLTKGD